MFIGEVFFEPKINGSIYVVVVLTMFCTIVCAIIVFHFAGPFCPLGVPEHDAFMNAIMKGNKPASLQAGTVVLSDHRHEEYKPTGQAAAPAVQ